MFTASNVLRLDTNVLIIYFLFTLGLNQNLSMILILMGGTTFMIQDGHTIIRQLIEISMKILELTFLKMSLGGSTRYRRKIYFAVDE